MDCLEFRRTAGAGPAHLDAEARAHVDSCAACAEFLAQVIAFDARILAALRVPVPDVPQAGAGRRIGQVQWIDRRRWFALAASILGGVTIGSLLWVGSPRGSLARALVGHVQHEPGATTVTAPADPARLAEVLRRGGIRLRPGIGTVSYAESCTFRRRTVPHLVVQTDRGPVTVMVLRHESVAGPVRFDEQGYRGTIVPAGPGSIAVIGAGGADPGPVAEHVLAAIEWNGEWNGN